MFSRLYKGYFIGPELVVLRGALRSLLRQEPPVQSCPLYVTHIVVTDVGMRHESRVRCRKQFNAFLKNDI